MWSFTNRLGEEEHQMLQQRLKDIIQDIGKCFK